MYSVKKKKPKDSFMQNTYGAFEDYLRDSEQKDNNNNYLIYSSNKKINYKPTNIKIISFIPKLEDGNFTETIKKFIQSENFHINYINNSNILDDVERSQNGHQIIIEKFQKNENDKDEISQNMEKIEILEDGSICKKNTTGMISSPSVGEKCVEIKNSNFEDTNKEMDTDILINSKLLITNNIKSLETENEGSNNNIFKNKDFNNNSTSLINKSIKDNIKDNEVNNFPYFSTSKKNQLMKESSETNFSKGENNLNKINKKKINTNIIKKRLIKTEIKNSKNLFRNNNIFDSDYSIKKTLENKNNCFIKEIEINNNYNELNYKRILFGDNFKEDDDIINQWKYLSNKYIKIYNKKLLSTNIQIITQNLKIQKILQEKNKSKDNIISVKNEENYFDSIKEEFNNIYFQDNIAQSINIIENYNRNDSDSDFISKQTDISYILKPPINNYNNTYENTFEEIDILSEQNLKNQNDKIKKYQCDIESIDEEMNESYEEQEYKEEKNQKEINIPIKIYSNEKIKNISKINHPLIDKNRIEFEINKISQQFNNIERAFKKQTENEIKDIESLSYSNTSVIDSNIKCPKRKDYLDENNQDISISRETETEMSDEEIIIDNKGKIVNNNNNSLIYKFLTYIIEKNEKENKIKIVFNNISDNKIKGKRYSINIKSYKKIMKMMFYKKRKPITKNSYESLIEIMIKNFEIYKKEILLKKSKKIYNEQEKEKMKNNIIKINNKIKELEETVKELKYLYIYGIIKKNLIKDKNEKRRFIKSLNISQKRNKIKELYKEILNILNNKIGDEEKISNYYKNLIDILKKHQKIDDEDINKEKNNKIIKYNDQTNKFKKNNKEKILFILLPLMYIINYFANSYNSYEYNEIF